MPAGSDVDFEHRFEDALDEVPDDQFDRERFVPGTGPLDATVMLIGEAPGEREIAEGVPFVGNAGRRLGSILEDVGIDRDELYVTNLVKVRVEGNADPTRDAIDAWRPVLSAELEAVDPDVVVPLGNFATHELLPVDDGISEIRGDPVELDGRTVVPTFHPAATFYDESKRPPLEEDLRTAAREAGLKQPGGGKADLEAVIEEIHNDVN